MINYKKWDYLLSRYINIKETAKEFVDRYNIDYKKLKELLTYGILHLSQFSIIYINANNYRYRNLLKREVADKYGDEELKQLIGKL